MESTNNSYKNSNIQDEKSKEINENMQLGQRLTSLQNHKKEECTCSKNESVAMITMKDSLISRGAECGMNGQSKHLI